MMKIFQVFMFKCITPNLGKAEMFLCTRVVVDNNFFDGPESNAHLLQEVLVDIVVYIYERHLLRPNWKYIVLVNLIKIN